MTKDYMTEFRQTRKAMGFTYTSAYVPTNKITEFSLFVERLKAERMLEILEMLPTSRERIVLAGRNTTEVPTPQEVKALLARHPHQTAMSKLGAACIESLELANSHMNVSKTEQETEALTKHMSAAVAYNHMANVQWRELAYMASQIGGQVGATNT